MAAEADDVFTTGQRAAQTQREDLDIKAVADDVININVRVMPSLAVRIHNMG